MAPRTANRRAQRGVALLGLLAVAVVVFAYVLTSRLNAASQFVGIDRDNNARVLAQAKQALIGWMAINAATDNNPGRLPCPQAWGDVGSANEGRAAGNCGVPAAGWLPWRTLGMDRPLDASGNQIWYVISPGWHLPSAGATLSINSDSTGQLALDGQSVVALLIAPGPALAIAPNPDQIAAGCAARSQSQVLALPGTPPDPLDFLECQNGSTADNVFATSVVDNAVNQVFNDQVLAITAADVMPALEAAIADRMQREIAPVLAAATYTTAEYPSIPTGVPVYPYPVPMADVPPGPPYPAGSYIGASGTLQGLLPFNQISAPCTAPPPCASLSVPTVRVVTGAGFGGYFEPPAPTCSISATELLCTGQYHEDVGDPTLPVRIEMTATFPVAMGFRVRTTVPFLPSPPVEARDDDTVTPWLTPSPVNFQFKMNDGVTALPNLTVPPAGSVTIHYQATLPNIDANGWETYADFRIRINRAVFGDHALLDKTDATLGWFVRNEWYRNVYYAVAKRNTADVLAMSPNGCTTNPGDPPDDRCLSFNDPATPNVRALLVLAGRRLPTQITPRPTSNRLDYVEFKNGDNDTYYEQRWPRMSKISIASPLYAPSNDRIVLVNPLPSSALASQVDPVTSRIVTLP